MKIKPNKQGKIIACAPLIIVPAGLDSETLGLIKASGYVPIRTDEPDKVRLVYAQTEIIGGDLLMSALEGLIKGDHSESMELFTKELYRRLKANDSKAIKPLPPQPKP